MEENPQNQVPKLQTYEQIMNDLSKIGRITEVKKNIWAIRAKIFLAALGICAISILFFGLTILVVNLVVKVLVS